MANNSLCRPTNWNVNAKKKHSRLAPNIIEIIFIYNKCIKVYWSTNLNVNFENERFACQSTHILKPALKKNNLISFDRLSPNQPKLLEIIFDMTNVLGFIGKLINCASQPTRM